MYLFECCLNFFLTIGAKEEEEKGVVMVVAYFNRLNKTYAIKISKK